MKDEQNKIIMTINSSYNNELTYSSHMYLQGAGCTMKNSNIYSVF